MAAETIDPDVRTTLPRAIGLRMAGAGRRGGAALRLILRTTSGRIALPIVLLHVTLALFGPWLAPYSPTEFQYPSNNITGSTVQYEALDGLWPRVSVTDASQFSVGDVIRIDDEFMKITDIVANTLHVTRGYEGTVAAAHPQLQQFLAPSFQFLLGTDNFGRDVLSRIMSGATSLILIAGSGAILGIALGTMVGMSSAYKGGRVDEVVMRVMDGLMSFPGLLMALLVLTTLGPSAVNISLTVGIVTMPRVARVIRSVTLSLKELEFVQSARLRGEPAFYIIFREILPNTLPVLGVELSVRLSYAILIVSSLGFLGMGVQPPSSDWGLMIAQSRSFLSSAPWVALAPAGAVASLVVGVNLLTDGVRQASGLPSEDKP